MNKRIKISVIFIGIMLFIVLILSLSNSWATVGQGHAMLIVDARSHTVSQPILGPAAGFYFDPFARMAGQEYPVDIYYATAVFEDNVSCFSSDQLEMMIEIQMRWQLNTSRLVDLYKSYPKLDYQSSAIESIAEKNIRLVTSNFTALQTIDERSIVSREMQQQVLTALDTEPSLQGALNYMTFDMKNIGYPEDYTSAIEEKLAAQQKALGAQYQSESIIILANATAQQAIIQARGQAEANVLIANSTRQAIEMILQASGNTNSTSIAELYLYVEAIKQIAPYVKNFYLFSGQVGSPMILLPNDNSTSTSP
jgi:regulator of protease activity HflC (stomatin/prohibitin superfamily)